METSKSEISIVIPTYNRSEQLARVLEYILASDVIGFRDVEVIVVDDGSNKPARSVVESLRTPSPFHLKYIYQDNAGPAAARNNGFRCATHEIVLFIDDDILVLPGLIRRHVETHERLSGSVVFGVCPLAQIYDHLPAKRYLDSLEAMGEIKEGIEQKFSIASGNLSVERNAFQNSVYKEDLATPGAEEFELAHRLNTLKIPIYQNYAAVGWHLQSPLIEDKCRQEFKYGISVAEAFSKVPELAGNEQFRKLSMINGSIDFRRDAFGLIATKAIKSVASHDISRGILLRITHTLEARFPREQILFPLYRLLSGLSLFAGVRKGLGQWERS